MLFTLLCASTNPAPSIILLPHCWPTPCNGIPHYASISTMVNWSMPISHNMVFILLFILNHKLCRQLPAERMKFDIAASVIFKEPESSFERSSFLHVSTFSQQIFGENNGFNEQCFNRAYSAIVSRQSTILQKWKFWYFSPTIFKAKNCSKEREKVIQFIQNKYQVRLLYSPSGYFQGKTVSFSMEHKNRQRCTF